MKIQKKRPQGRPPREDEPERVVARIPGELKHWLRSRADAEDRDMSEIVAEALKVYRCGPTAKAEGQ